MAHPNLSCLSFAIGLFVYTSCIQPAISDEQALITLINRLNTDVIELRNQIETSYSNRCDAILGCPRANYDECQSEMSSSQTCPNIKQLGYAVPECGKGVLCNALFDYGSTTVRLPGHLVSGPNSNPTNPMVVEAVCSSRKAEQWMIDKYEEDKSFWNSLGVDFPQMYFGSATGMFRIFPGRHSRECGQYDPRVRPWYKGAVPSTISNTVKPRHVVMLLDKSLSMGDTMSATTNQTKISYMKSIVNTVLRLLTDNDSVAVITFSETARLRGSGKNLPPFYWKPANGSNIQTLIDEVNNLQASGRSNWLEGFDFAFDLIDNSLQEINSNGTAECKVENVALLFFSDGGMNLPIGITDDDITEYVASRVRSAEAIGDGGDFYIHPFYFSIANDDPQQVTKAISCASGGIWKPLNEDMGPGNVTMGYETLFSTPMATELFYNFTTWSEPYTFTSSGKTGYTVSALVYDRTVEPARFIGAVGMDILVSAAQNVYGGTEDETEAAIKRITSNITQANFAVTCDQQRINLTYCELQSLRHFSGGDASICIPKRFQTNGTDAEFVTDVANETNITASLVDLYDVPSHDILDILNCSKAFVVPCPGMDEYPKELWNNVNLQGMSFEERACCQVGTNVTTDQCPKLDEVQVLGLSKEAIFSFIFIPLVVIELLGCYFCLFRKRKKNEQEDGE